MNIQNYALLLLSVAQAVLMICQPTAAFSEDKLPKYRYTCVSPDGQSLLIENSTKRVAGYVHRVDLSKTWLAACLAKGKHIDLAWDSYRETRTKLSKKDPNDIIAHFVTKALLPACDPERHPNPMASSIEYGESCYHNITHDIRIDVANPLDSELTMRNTFGEVASGDTGLGRMAEPDQIAQQASAQFSGISLSGKHIVISAGPTVEDLDPVRYVGNRSSGKMGFALAERARAFGAKVTLIAGPVNLPTPPGVQRIDVRSTLSMRSALWQALSPDLSAADALIMTAAVADYRPAQSHSTKLKRGAEPMSVELLPNPDLLEEIGHARKDRKPILIGFALETDIDEKVIQLARGKLAAKHVDMVVANHASESLGKDDIRAMLVSPTDCSPLPLLSKEQAADRILAWLAGRLRDNA